MKTTLSYWSTQSLAASNPEDLSFLSRSDCGCPFDSVVALGPLFLIVGRLVLSDLCSLRKRCCWCGGEGRLGRENGRRCHRRGGGKSCSDRWLLQEGCRTFTLGYRYVLFSGISLVVGVWLLSLKTTYDSISFYFW